MEKIRQSDGGTPHRSTMRALLVAAIAAIVIIESTEASEWIAETGFIHLVAISFVVLAATTAMRLRSMIVGEFKPFLKRVLVALAILGLSHLVEYMIDVKHVVDPDLAPLFVAGLYTVAAAVMVSASGMLLRSAGDRMRTTWVVAATGIVVPIAVVIAAFPRVASGQGLEPLFVMAFFALSTVAIFAIEYFTRVGRRFPVLSPVVRNINSAVIAVMFAGIAELASLFLADKLPVSEWVYENVSHYVFYTGLTIMYLAFDAPQHFGGVFADMRGIIAEESKGPTSG
ncbi:MAG TPA: hypothetical protein VL500_00755 [Candidatus Eisenbacteria bacterium]|jgi:hypothetical protein|nr:hypothetical protein [Candidatus Eisenbacteria bacterium]